MTRTKDLSTYEEKDGSYLIARKARKAHPCDDKMSRYCQRVIQPGEKYVSVTAFPNDVLDRIYRGTSCVYCSSIRGRDHLLYPLPEAQLEAFRYWDIDSELLERRHGGYGLGMKSEPMDGTRIQIVRQQLAAA
ncbi:hypothetical protein GCM10025867_50750 (plasmid) [Frondihabitans sucicola]|uniref:Uncharacterized protein n=1 Tax=Frondihabitans sucicola TaxID=1268041 RepID=A0ABM8GWH2_9MICO|nr:hypothetical protein [Frondihabitans sucicola]BDZ52834.1 hypothetical protein GCM10025867_50750 [Frondihabitans sucicola]